MKVDSSVQANPKVKPSLQPKERDPKRPFDWQFLHPKYWGIWLAFALILPLIYLPLRWQFWLGKQLGILIYRIVGSLRRDTLVNLKLAFPDQSNAEREQMARQVFINQGVGVFETLCAWFRPQAFGDIDTLVSVTGLEHLQDAQTNGKAVLLLGGHYTMLDLGGLLFRHLSAIDCVYRPQNNALLDWFIFNGRRHIFERQIEHRDMRLLATRLKEGKVVWYSPDQDYGLKHGVMAPFFGIPSATITAPRRLARLGEKKNPPAVMALHTYRTSPHTLSSGERPQYQITITPALTDYPTKDEVADATRVNQVLEDLIRIDPTQWMWFHKRFKHNETGRTKYYD